MPFAALWVLLDGLGGHLVPRKAFMLQNDSSWYHLGPRLGPPKMAYVMFLVNFLMFFLKTSFGIDFGSPPGPILEGFCTDVASLFAHML